MKAIEWTGSALRLLDQTRLPHESVWITCETAEDVARAIEEMRVRGAPAIAIAAAYGVALAALEASRNADAETVDKAASKTGVLRRIEEAVRRLRQTRPTAVNLFQALRRIEMVVAMSRDLTPAALAGRLAAEADRMAAEDVAVNRRIGTFGAAVFRQPVRVLTHCNTGSLATVEYGTALGVIRSLHHQGKLRHVWVDETRPFLQGARLTAYELLADGIPFTLITDSMAAHFMRAGQVDAVVVGADRIAANGDTANKIGTYGLAVLCHHHRIPFYVAAPSTTFDLSIPSGASIPIEERASGEVTHVLGLPVAPAGVCAAHPAFDVTPAELITGIVTEFGVVEPNAERIRATLAAGGRQEGGDGA
ncbi:MAG: S-methyl-5-thioribose-1-phosphate isomerase [Alicyclobacillus sp.]|nr:S-methyl-5-thioribose-1-phosphate isomerase [Alicyclobacillus sp.]MCL6515521.1 S-methyl-5-thioribose-1-phosphate isomerase [Alicyclobacillus sp.]